MWAVRADSVAPAYCRAPLHRPMPLSGSCPLVADTPAGRHKARAYWPSPSGRHIGIVLFCRLARQPAPRARGCFPLVQWPKVCHPLARVECSPRPHRICLQVGACRFIGGCAPPYPAPAATARGVAEVLINEILISLLWLRGHSLPPPAPPG